MRKENNGGSMGSDLTKVLQFLEHNVTAQDGAVRVQKHLAQTDPTGEVDANGNNVDFGVPVQCRRWHSSLPPGTMGGLTRRWHSSLPPGTMGGLTHDVSVSTPDLLPPSLATLLAHADGVDASQNSAPMSPPLSLATTYTRPPGNFLPQSNLAGRKNL
jgi:hypothetical protein